MGWSGLIYAAIVAGWAAVLVPRWVRRNEEAERARAADVLAGIRVLERRPPEALGNSTSRRQALHAPHPPVPDLPPRPRPADPGRVTGARSVPVPAPRRLAHAAAARRRRALTVLVAVLVVTGTTVVAGLVPTLALAGPAALLAVYVALARRAVRRESHALAQARTRQARYAIVARVHRDRVATSRAVNIDADDRDGRLSGAATYTATVQAPPTDVRAWRAVLPAAEASGAGPTDSYAATADEFDETDSWAPVPVPLPTYVTAPKAPWVIRRIDLSSSQAWTAGGPGQGDGAAGREVRVGRHDRDDPPAAFPELPPLLASSAAELDGADQRDTGSDDPDEDYEHRRAVGD